MHFVCDRVRKAAAKERQPQRAERAIGTSEQRCFFSASDDEVGRSKAAMREQLGTLGEQVRSLQDRKV